MTNEKGKTTLVDIDTDDDFDVEDVDEARLHETTIILEGEEVNVEELGPFLKLKNNVSSSYFWIPYCVLYDF